MEIPEELTHSPYLRMLGCEVRSLGSGVAKSRCLWKRTCATGGNMMHGGAIFSLVDIAMGLACSSAHGFEQRSVTIECKINYVRGVSDGEVLCVARVLHAGRRTLVVEAEVLQADKLVAKAQGTFAIV